MDSCKNFDPYEGVHDGLIRTMECFNIENEQINTWRAFTQKWSPINKVIDKLIAN